MSEQQSEPIAERLKRLRLARGLSQRDLSSPGVSYAYISRIEGGARTPSVKALRKLAARLDVTVEYLETGHDKTLVDTLIHELSSRTSSPVRIVAFGNLGAHVRYARDERLRSQRAATLTEALLKAVAVERERDELRERAQEIAAQESALA